MTERNEGRPDGMDRPLKIQGSGASGATLSKRFYQHVTVEPAATGSGFSIHLDGRPVRTPAKRVLVVPFVSLAEALAGEWRAQTERIDPRTMPTTRLINSGLDGVTGREAEVAADIVKFAGSDLLCYRAEHPTELVAMQARHWDPILDWASCELGGRFASAAGVMHVAQDPSLAERLGDRISGLGALALAGLHVMTTLSGSALLAWAVSSGRIDAEEAWTAAHVDEDWQISQWGEDAEAAARRAARKAEFMAAARLVTMLADGARGGA